MNNHTVYFDPSFSYNHRRRRIHEGQPFVSSPRKASLVLCKLAQGLIEGAFAPRDPIVVQRDLSVECYAEILGGRS